MVNNILGYQNRAGMNNLLQQSSANLTNQMMPQINMPNPLLGMDLSPPPPTPPSFYDKIRSGAMDTASGLAGAFTGEGSSARLSALGASLLSGPSRTPVSFGSSLSQGLLAGNQAVQAEKDRKFNRSLLEQEMDYKMKSLAAKPSKDALYNITQIGPDGSPFTFTVNQDGVSSYYNDPNSTITKVGAGSETGNTPTVLTAAAQNIENMGGELSKDTVVDERGNVSILQGSPTDVKNQFEQRKIAINEGRAENDDNQAKLDFDIKQYNFSQDQNVEERKKSNAWEQAYNTSLKIKDIKNLLIKHGSKNVTGPMAIIGSVPVFGESTPQGQVAADLETLVSNLTKMSIDSFRAGSSAGATGFGALNEKELAIIKSLLSNVGQYQDDGQLLRNLNRLENSMDALMYGVIDNGEYEDYVPSKHADKMEKGTVFPATENNTKMIGVPTEKEYPKLKGARYLGRTVNGSFKFNIPQANGTFKTQILGV